MTTPRRRSRHARAATLGLVGLAVGVSFGVAQTWQPTAGPYEASTTEADLSFSAASPQVGWLLPDILDTAYVTLDGGGSWRSAFFSGYYDALAVDQVHPGMAWLAELFGDVAVTTDTGRTWRSCTPHGYISAVLAKQGKAWLAYWGIYVSTDTGRTWVTTSTPSSGFVHDLVDGVQDGVLFAALGNAGGEYAAVWKSTDGGQSWLASDSGMPWGTEAYQLAVAHSAPMVLYVAADNGLWKTANQGVSWVCVAWADSVLTHVAVDPVDPSLVYVAHAYGVYRSTDGGSTWSRAGIWTRRASYAPSYGTTHALSCPSASAVWWANNVSTDRGASWRSVGPGLPRMWYYQSLGAARFVRGIQNTEIRWIRGWKTTDGGQSWYFGGPDGSMAIHPSDQQKLYCVDYNYLWRSLDGGSSWGAVELPAGATPGPTAVHPSDPNVVFACTGGVLRRTTDSGTSWAIVNPGTGADISDIRICRQHPDTVFICGLSGCYRSDDGGLHWAAKNDTLTNVGAASLLVDPDQDNVVYMCGPTCYFHRSTDYGETWTEFRDYARTGSCMDIARHPSYASTLYMAAYSGAVYRSTDAGHTWASIGLSGRPVYSLSVTASTPPTLYAAVMYDGVWKHVDSGGGIAEAQRVEDRRHPTTTVVHGVLFLPTASSHKPQAASWLLDITGRKVMALHSGANDVSKLAPGVYFVRGGLKHAQAERKVIISR